MILLIVFLSSLGAGYLTGKARSPNYQKADQAAGLIENYVAKSSLVSEPMWSIERGSDGRLNAVLLTDGLISLPCGYTRYFKRLSTGAEAEDEDWQELGKGRLPPDFHDEPFDDAGPRLRALYGSNLPPIEPHSRGIAREGVSPNEVIGVMIGGAEIYTIKFAAGEVAAYWSEVRSASRMKRSVKALQIATAAVSGFALGFYLGYEDSPDCGSQVIRDQLKEPAFWRAVGKDLSGHYSMRLDRDPQSGVITGLETAGGFRPSLRDAWLTVHSVVNDRRLAVDRGSFVISKNVKDVLTSSTQARDPYEYLPFWALIADSVASVFAKSYRESEFSWDLARASFEKEMWVKNDEHTWKPTASTSDEIAIERCYLPLERDDYQFLLGR